MKKLSPYDFAGKRALACLGAAMLAGACTGIVSSPGAPPTSIDPPGGTPSGAGGGVGPGSNGGSTDVAIVVANPPKFAPAAGLLRRLTRAQFRNAVRDVFGVDVSVSDLEADNWNTRFATVGAATVVTSDRGVEQYNTAIESAVNAVFSDATKRATFIGCTPSGQASDSCLRGYIQKLGLRAWRRPLESGELDRFVTLGAKASTDLGSPVEGARWATVALFESPSFLYRPELGAAASNGAMRLTPYEIASRLSFLIWNSLPDQMLLDQAAAGMLGTADGIRTAATRLLDAAAGRESIGAFAEEYMRLDRVASQAKDPTAFPEYGANLQAGMIRDMRDTWASLAFDDQGSALDLFTTNKVVVNLDLAKLYGLDTTGLTSTTFQTRTLPDDGPRAGILSKAGFLSEFANQQSGSPTLRGKFMRDSMMCLNVPSPPPNVNTSAVDTGTTGTKRQRLEAHRKDPACAGCHALMDPLGLPLENFDAIGKFRTMDNGLPVDPTSTFDGQPVANARELGVAASKSIPVAQCLLRGYYSYAVGHEERPEDGSVLNALAASFKKSGFKLRDLVLAVVTQDAFTSVAPQP